MAKYISKDELMQYLEPLTNTPAIVIKRYVENMPAVDIQNSQELIYKKACGVDVEASIEAQKSWEQWCDNVKAIQERNLLETENADNNYSQFIKDISEEPISEMREIKEGCL